MKTFSTTPVALQFSKAVGHHVIGQHAEAERLYRGILAQDPGHAQSLHMLGIIALQAARYADAHALISAALPALDSCADVHNHLGIALEQLGRLTEAASAYRAALQLQPNFIIANNLGVVLQKTGDSEAAIASFSQAVDLQPDCAVAHNNLGAMLDRLGRFEAAMAAYGRALDIDASYAEAHLNMGIALRAQGRTLEARVAVERALTADPASAYAWYILSDMKTFVPGDPDLCRLEALLAAPNRPTKDRIDLAFAVGKAKLDIGDVAGAFETYHTANRLKRQTFTYSVADQTADMTRIAETFSQSFVGRCSGAGISSDLPVFIIGMPRSGTTLIEQILASHHAVHGGGELPMGPDMEACLRAVTTSGRVDEVRFRQALPDLGRTYLQTVTPLGAGRQHVTNKAMGLFRYPGLLHLMLPNSRFIYCRRDPMDICFSCYTKNFAEEQNFAYDLHELGTYYAAYERLMSHWCDVLPQERLLVVDYESVTAELEDQARRLVSFLGLAWDAACLDFHLTRRRVHTASVDQVRRPIYRSSVGRWRRHANDLQPLLAALAHHPTIRVHPSDKDARQDKELERSGRSSDSIRSENALGRSAT